MTSGPGPSRTESNAGGTPLPEPLPMRRYRSAAKGCPRAVVNYVTGDQLPVTGGRTRATAERAPTATGDHRSPVTQLRVVQILRVLRYAPRMSSALAARARFAELVGAGDDGIDLAEAALLIAAEAYPGL